MSASLGTDSCAKDLVRAVILDFEPTTPRPGRPHLECPLPAAINPHVQRAHRHTLAWASRRQLVAPGSRAAARVREARFSWLTARSYPDITAEQLALASDWIAFLFFYDDLCDTERAAAAGYRDELTALEDRLIDLAFQAPIEDRDPPLARALSDILARVSRRAHRSWLDRLAEHLHDYIEGVRWERLLRLQRCTPSLATYARLRLLISAVHPCFDLAGLFIDGRRADFTRNVWLRQLEIMASNYICWVNDIYGVDKELREGTTSNLVVVLARDQALSWDEALARAITMCNAELMAFLDLERQLPLLRDSTSRAYVDALKSWMRGNLDWYAETRRYGRALRRARPRLVG